MKKRGKGYRLLSGVLLVMLIIGTCTGAYAQEKLAVGTPSRPSSRTRTQIRSYGELPISWMEASSTRVDSEYRDSRGNYFSYPPENLLDGKPDTCWTPALHKDVVGNGVGEYVDFYFEGVAEISGISVMNGYCKSRDLFFANSRPAELSISFLYVGAQRFTDAVTITLQDGFYGYQNFTFTAGMEDVEAVRVQISRVYGGTKYKGDVCISEIRIQGAWM